MMKLQIKKEFFDKLGIKNICEYRDAHITFVCEETGKKKKFDIRSIGLVPRRSLPKKLQKRDDLFEDDHQIKFRLEV